jgi:hypothetical protein
VNSVPDILNSGVTLNAVTVTGRLLADAEFFSTRSGKPKITFRIAIPRAPDLPRKKPATYDFYSVIAYGERFVPLLEHLIEGRLVVVTGWVQSRDVEMPNGGNRTVNEIGARAILPVLDPAFLPSLDRLVAAVLAGLSPQECQEFRAAMEASNWHRPKDQPATWAEDVEALFAPDGSMHPEIRRSVERLIQLQEEVGGD